MPGRTHTGNEISLVQANLRTENRPELLIAGVSARAAAQSAVAAEFNVVALDRFGDADLRRLCETRTFSAWDELPALAEKFSPRPWIYTGGMENRPELIACISRRHQLLGCDAPAVNPVRDACSLAKAVSAAGFLMPETRLRPPADVDVAWLRKPRLSGGGVGITRWENGAERSGGARPQIYQRLIPGEAYGAVFLAADGKTTTSATTLWGVSRQLLAGELQPSADPNPLGPFQYCGSIGPVKLAASTQEELRRLGSWLADQFGLRGMFGVDFVLNGNRPWLIEVNPRYTASAEVLERASRQSAAALHWQACQFESFDKGTSAAATNKEVAKQAAPDSKRSLAGEIVGKRILYVPRRLQISSEASAQLLDRAAKAKDLADIPAGQSTIEAGHPVATVYATGCNLATCESTLADRAQQLWEMLVGLGH